MTDKQLHHKLLVPNIALRQLIQQWREQHPEAALEATKSADIAAAAADDMSQG
jgi:hypothetical protein